MYSYPGIWYNTHMDLTLTQMEVICGQTNQGSMAVSDRRVSDGLGHEVCLSGCWLQPELRDQQYEADVREPTFPGCVPGGNGGTPSLEQGSHRGRARPHQGWLGRLFGRVR